MASLARNEDDNNLTSTSEDPTEIPVEGAPLLGSEAWFTNVVGLPNWGLHPYKDTHHVSNKLLLFLFEEKATSKGYLWERCKSDKVRMRMKDLYMPVFQVTSIPPDVCESFTRAVVSEVLFFMNMNWAMLAEEKWRGKLHSPAGEQVLIYREAGEDVTYKHVVQKRLCAEKSLAESEIIELEEDQKYAEEKVQQLQNSLVSASASQSYKEMDVEIHKLKEQISMEEADEAHNKKMLDYLKRADPDSARVEELIQKLTNNESEIARLKEEEEKLDEVHCEANSNLKIALEDVSFIKNEIKRRKEYLSHQTKTIEKVNRADRRPRTLTPSPFIGDSESDEDDELGRKTCPLCGKTFPKLDVIMASCKCLYHPWCIVTTAWISKECVEEACKLEFTTEWIKSMGLANCNDEIQEFMADPRRSPDPPRRGHLNSDIGGLTPRTKMYRALAATATSGKKESKKRK